METRLQIHKSTELVQTNKAANSQENNIGVSHETKGIGFLASKMTQWIPQMISKINRLLILKSEGKMCENSTAMIKVA